MRVVGSKKDSIINRICLAEFNSSVRPPTRHCVMAVHFSCSEQLFAAGIKVPGLLGAH